MNTQVGLLRAIPKKCAYQWAHVLTQTTEVINQNCAKKSCAKLIQNPHGLAIFSKRSWTSEAGFLQMQFFTTYLCPSSAGCPWLTPMTSSVTSPAKPGHVAMIPELCTCCLKSQGSAKQKLNDEVSWLRNSPGLSFNGGTNFILFPLHGS